MDKSETELRNGWSTYPVDIWNQRRPPDKLGDLSFWTYCAKKYGTPILDVCCGNGRISIPLAELGYEVVGVDINADFVGVAQDRVSRLVAEGKSLKASFTVTDIVRLNLQRQFRLAIMPDWTFQVLLTQEDQLSFLKSLHKLLGSAGVFAFNLFIPFHRQQGLIKKDAGYEWPSNPSDHNSVLRTYDPIAQIETVVETNIPPIRFRHTTLAELKLLFQIAKFEIVEMYGDVDRRPFTGSCGDDYTIIVKPT